MNFKEWIWPFTFALITTWAIQYFVLNRFLSREEKPDSAGKVSFVAPTTELAERPLQLEVNFLDKEKVIEEQEVEVSTQWATFTFSNHGAILKRALFVHESSSIYPMIQTINHDNLQEKDGACFMVAFDEVTPYYYTLIERKEDEQTVELLYKNHSSTAEIHKKYIIYKEQNRVDVSLTCKPKREAESLQLRILFPAPDMPQVKYDTVSGVMVNANQGFEQYSRTSIDVQKGWIRPALFGTDNRYFVHALVSDNHNAFVQRAYYKLTGANQIISIIEGPEINKKTTWNLSFYLGPKLEHKIIAVDERLKNTLGYAGWLSFIARFLLMVLKYLYSVFANFGVAILILTFLLKLVLLPFTLKSKAGAQKSKEYAKKMAYLKQRYKDDPERLQQEQLTFIREHGMPKLGLFPLLLQIPFFIAMRSILFSSVELYGASFLWIPDLSSTDPYYLLPLFVFFGFVMQGIYAEKSQRTMFFALGIIIGTVMVNVSAGLGLYLCANSIFTVIQNAAIERVGK